MRFTAYYIVRPNDALLERLTLEEEGLREAIAPAEVWSKQEGGRTAWTPAEHSTCVKLLFITNFARNYGSGERSARLTHDLLGAPPFGEEVFDRWWTLERFGGADEDFDAIAMALTPADYDRLDPGGSARVSTWIRSRADASGGK
jgi:hypothetical protein